MLALTLACTLAVVAVGVLCQTVCASEARKVPALMEASNIPLQTSGWNVEHCCGSQLASLHLELRGQQDTDTLFGTTKHPGRTSADPRDQPFSLLILSIVKDSSSWGNDRDFQAYLNLLLNITQDTPNLQLALGLSIADEHTFSGVGCSLAVHTGDAKLQEFCSTHNQMGAKAVGRNMHKLRLQRMALIHAPQSALLASLTDRSKRNPEKQMLRRKALATLRNQLLFRALKHEAAVLWIDADIAAAPSDMVPAMIASNKDIITPLCFFPKRAWWHHQLAYFDYNVFQGVPDRPEHDEVLQIANGSLYPQRDRQVRYGNIRYLDELHMEDPSLKFIELDSVGGTILWVKAAVHRDGVIFPVANAVGAEWDRQGYLGLETEGICWMAGFLGYKCWGMPLTTIMHSAIK